MRKILLGTTAVVGAALVGMGSASAQQAPTVRIGGYFNFFAGYVQQNTQNQSGSPVILGSGDANNSSNNAVTSQNVSNLGTASPNSVSVGNVANTGATTAAGTGANQGTNLGSAKTNKWDFRSDAEIHIFVDGKTANGITYGAVVEIEDDFNEGQETVARRSYTAKTALATDEMYGFIATPRFGQVRYGDEDGVAGGLMNTGVITNFGTGGVYGEWQNFVIRSGPRTTTSPGDLGDNTKIIYLSPQFFGFDFGGSFAPNMGQGAGNGCVQNIPTYTCDRTRAFTGATAFTGSINHDNYAMRRNEYQLMGRWRGTLGGVGLAVSGGWVGSAVVQDETISGNTGRTLQGLGVAVAGIEATAYGFTIGANWEHGRSNFFWQPLVRGSNVMDQWMAGASYAIGPVSIGANFVTGTFAGTQNVTGVFDTTQTATNPTVRPIGSAGTIKNAQQRRYGYSVGANYRLAPGLDLVAEYTHFHFRQRGVDLDGVGSNGTQDTQRADVFIVGSRLAF